MRKLFEKLNNDLAQFIEQRDNLAMVIRCHDYESAYILKSLQGIDDANNSDIFWMFADDFHNPESYVKTVIDHFKEKHQAVCEALKKDNKQPWPSLPEDMSDTSLSPVVRLKNLMVFSRKFLPQLDGQLVIWILFPYQTNDFNGYAELFGKLIQHEFPVPWCHNIRMYFRDDFETPILFNNFQHTKRLSWLNPDFSNEALNKSLEDELEDKELPFPQRMQSLMILAGLDLSYKRYKAALKKYRFLLLYYQTNGELEMSSLVLNWMGEVFERTGSPSKAQEYYESAITPAVEAKANPILLNISLNLANLKLSQKLWHESEIYYDSAEKISTALLIPQVEIQSLENRGVCQYMQKKYEEAIKSWEEGATLAREMEEKYLLKNILKRLYEYYDQNRQIDKCTEINIELDRLESI